MDSQNDSSTVSRPDPTPVQGSMRRVRTGASVMSFGPSFHPGSDMYKSEDFSSLAGGMPVDVVNEKPGLHQLQRIPRLQISKRLGNMLEPLAALSGTLAGSPDSIRQESSESTLVRTMVGGSARAEVPVRTEIAKCLDDVKELEQSAQGLKIILEKQGAESLTDWAILAKFRDLCALIRKCFDSNGFQASEEPFSDAAGTYWNQSLIVASDLLSLLEEARPGMIIFADGGKEDQESGKEDHLSESNLSFFPTVDGFSENGSHNSQSPTVVINPSPGKPGFDIPQGSQISCFTLNDVMSSPEFSPDDRYAIGRGINALVPESAYNSVYDLASRRTSVAPSVAASVGDSTMSVAMTDLLKEVSQQLIGEASFGSLP